MLNRKELIERNDKKYEEMFKQISIPDFTKTIAQFSGMNIQDVSEDVIFRYLSLWAKNKYRFFEMMGNKIRIDKPIEYVNCDLDIRNDIRELETQYPGYAIWLDGFKGIRKNKIEDEYDLGYDTRDWINSLFSDCRISGMTMTHFFKKYLQAPDELITAIGRIFEHERISAKYTISIDPVDMMLASENPYGWTSCYRLSDNNDASHADGCLAATLDSSSLITYVWNNEGKFSFYNAFEFKNIRYKRMRRWISINNTFNAIHFNMIYPGKSAYPEEFDSLLRNIIEEYVCDYTKEENKWSRNESWRTDCSRTFGYGYGEYNSDYIYVLTRDKEKEFNWEVFNEAIECPCGCGCTLPCSDSCEDDGYRYNGAGFRYENFDEVYYCEYCDDYCSHECCEEYCRGCSCWDDSHPVCDLDRDELCDNPDYYYTEDGIMESNEDHCSGCPLYKYHCCHEEDDYEERKIREEE